MKIGVWGSPITTCTYVYKTQKFCNMWGIKSLEFRAKKKGPARQSILSGRCRSTSRGQGLSFFLSYFISFKLVGWAEKKTTSYLALRPLLSMMLLHRISTTRSIRVRKTSRKYKIIAKCLNYTRIAFI